VAVAVGVAYAGSFQAGFVFDSRAIILENPRIRAATIENVRLIVSEDYWQPHAAGGLYRPLATLSYLFNHAVLGNADRPFGYHAVNLLLHMGCTALVYALVWHLARRGWPALAAATLFGLHPITTEAVTNVVGRADLLAAFGVLGALLCHAYGQGSDGRWSAAWSAGVLLAAGVAFFSKESGLALVLVLLAYDLGLRGRVAPRDHLLVGALALAYLGARWWVATRGLPVEDVSPLDNPIVEASTLAGLATALKVLGRELWLLLVPITLSADYSFRAIAPVRWPPGVDWRALCGLVALALLAVAAVRARRAVPALPFVVAAFGLALLPTSNLLVTIGSIMAERFLYLPLAPFAGALALLADHVRARDAGRRGAVVTAVFAVVAVAFACRTWARNADWRDELQLWASTVRAVPESAKAHKAHAVALFVADGGRERIDQVIAAGERAVALRPDYQGALIDLGSYYLTKGDLLASGPGDQAARPWYGKAVTVLERARTLDQASARRFAEKMQARGHPPESLPDVGNAQLYQNLSIAYVRAERLEDAVGAYEQSRRLSPTDPTHYVDLSGVLARLGRWEEAAVALFEAVTIDPAHHDAAIRLVELYRTFYPEGRAIATDRPNEVVINLDDPAVRSHRCRAYDGLVRIYTQAKRPEDAARARALATEQCRRKVAARGAWSRNLMAARRGSRNRIASPKRGARGRSHGMERA
jgi:tetratricopeptide (TPR) repeat protein